MTDTTASDAAWRQHELEQRKRRAAMTYEERLNWLVSAKEFAAAAAGAAKQR